MRKTTLYFKLFTLVIGCLFLASCSDDDDEPTPLSNQLEYDSHTYDLDMGLTFDFGSFGFGSEKTHYAQGVLLTDSKSLNQSPTIALRLYLFSSGTVVPMTGTFEFGDVGNLAPDRVVQKYKWRNFYLNSGLLLDMNKDNELDPVQEYIEMRTGTVTLSGTAPNYTVDCDVTLKTGKKLKAQFKGTFIPIPTSSTDDDITSDLSKALLP